MKRKIFIGSSKEGIKLATQIKEKINSKLGDWVDCEIWNEGKVFSLNKGTLECLVKASRKYDYGIMLASKDDVYIKRYRIFNKMRDNVLFEMGLFLGSLGLQRSFLITHEDTSLPSDFNGVTVVKYNEKNIDEKIDCIISKLEGTKESFNLKPMPSVALALGYFQSFIIPFSKKHFEKSPEFQLDVKIPKNISDIDSQIEKYKKINPSVKSSDDNRPIAYRYLEGENKYWDIPSTLKTIDSLMDYFLPSSEVGIDIERQEWIEHELRNFKGTLTVLVNKNNAYINNIFIDII